MELGRELTQKFYAGETDSLIGRFSDELSDAVGGAPGLRAFRDGFLSDVGQETGVISEEVLPQGVASVYQRVATFQQAGFAVLIQWAFDPTGTILGLFIGPAEAPGEAPSEHLDHETQTELRLPFDGEWLVVWGGRTVEQNYHAAYPDQRFALDFLVVRDGSSHAGEGMSNEDYYCFGLPILASGAGTVVTAADGAPDRTPGELIDHESLGNHVIIDHGNGEYSFLAHLKQGSVLVSEGQYVQAGEELGECGNSGRSSEPHLHYHLQTTPDFAAGEGLPTQFNRYSADGEFIERGEPLQGQIVEATD